MTIRRKEGKLIVRHNADQPTPFLRSIEPFLVRLCRLARAQNQPLYIPRAIDVGCGNCRNTQLLASLGFEVLSFDQDPDHCGHIIDLEKHDLPVFPDTVNVVLLQYVLMFLTEKTRERLLMQCLDACSYPSLVVVELQPVRSGMMDVSACSKLVDAIRKTGRFYPLKVSRHRIAITDVALS